MARTLLPRLWNQHNRALNDVVFVVLEPQAEDQEKRSFARHGLHLLTAADVRALLEKAGLRIEREIPGKDRHRRFVCLVGQKGDPASAPQ